MMRNNRIIFVPLLCFCCGLFQTLYVSAQSPDSLRHLFPDENAVMLNQVLEYNIELKNGLPEVNSHSGEQIEYLKSGAAAYMGESGFSQSDFTQLTSYTAYTRTAEGKKLPVIDLKTSTDKQSFVFYDDVKYTSFNFPDVAPGAIGNLDVYYHDKDPHLLTPFYFTDRIPVINSELKVTVSKDISLGYQLVATDTSQVSVNIEHKHHDVIYTFRYKNCGADKYYADAPGFAWYSPHVVFYIEINSHAL